MMNGPLCRTCPYKISSFLYYRQVDYCSDSHLQRFGDIPKRSLKRCENLFWPEKPERLAISEIE